MTSLAPVIDLVAAHADLAYAAVLLLALSEAIPVVGAVVPGSFLVIAIATLVPTGAIKLWPLMFAAIIGAILGDGISYWLGHRYREAILEGWPLNRYPDVVEKSRAFIRRHGGKSVFLARFTPGVRTVVPILAGILGMPAGRFYLVNILSALAWAPAHILPGVLLGASLALAGAAAGRLALLLAIVAVLLWFVLWAVRLALHRGVPLIEAMEAWLWQWSTARDSWLARQVRPLLDPERPEGRTLLLWAGIVIASAWLFFGVLQDVVAGDPLVRVDAAIYRALQSLRTPAGDAVMVAITELGDTVVTTSVTILVFLWLAWQRAWRTAGYWLAAVGFAAILNTLTKIVVYRARPDELGYIGASRFSFPSGHATVNAVLYLFLAFLVTRELRPTWRLPAFAATASFAILIAFSRLYLGAHWFSDVIGSLAFATVWIIILGLAYVRHHERPLDHRRLAFVAWTALALVGGFEVFRGHAADMQRYAVRYETPAVTIADWWRTAWRYLPAYRVDLTGEKEEQLSLQWAGSLDYLRQRLLAPGWRAPQPWTASGALGFLITADPQELPVFPALEAGRLPEATLIKVNQGEADSRLVLRVWPADTDVSNETARPLWLGSLVDERISRPLSFVSIPHSAHDITAPGDIMALSLKGGAPRKTKMSGSQWDGVVFLADDRFPGLVPDRLDER